MEKKKIKQFFCGLRNHEWTCAAEEGIPATQEQLDNGIKGFDEYSTMYCKHCGYVYIPDKEKKKKSLFP